MKYLHIDIITGISPAKIDLNEVDQAITKVIQEQFNSACYSIRFHEHIGENDGGSGSESKSEAT